MAFNLKYWNQFSSGQFNETVRIEILEDDFVGTTTRIKMGCRLILEGDGDEPSVPIKKTSAELRIISETNNQFNEFFTNNDRQYQVVVRRGGTVKFQGFIESDSFEDTYISDRNYEIVVTAKDNLASLEDEPFRQDDGNLYEGLDSVLNVLQKCLNKTGQTLSINELISLRFEGMNLQAQLLSQIYVNQTGFRDNEDLLTCWEVISQIMTGLGCQLRQNNGQWYVTEQVQFYNRPRVERRDDIRFLNSNFQRVFEPAWKEFTLEQDYKVPTSIVNSGESNDDTYVNSVTPLLFDSTTIEHFNDGVDDPDNDDVFFHEAGSTAIRFVGSNRSSVDGGARQAYGGQVFSDGRASYMLTPTTLVEQSNRAYRFQTEFKSLIKTYDASGNYLGDHNSSALDVGPVVALILQPTSGSNVYALTTNGWESYANIRAVIADRDEFAYVSREVNSPVEIDYIFSGFPTQGNLRLLVTGSGTSTISGVPRVYYMTELTSLTVQQYDEQDDPITGAEITGSVDEDNNLTPDVIEISIGQVPVFPNSELLYLGGIFNSTGTPRINWNRADDTNTYNLLEAVGRGYNSIHRQERWRLSGDLTWNYDFITGIVENGKRLMLNSIDWDMSSDIATAEFVEIFQYVPTEPVIFTSGQITDGSTNNFFQVTDQRDFLAYTIDEGSPLRVHDLVTDNNPVGGFFLLDKSGNINSNKIGYTTLKNLILSDIDLSLYYTKVESDARFAAIAGSSTQDFSANNLTVTNAVTIGTNLTINGDLIINGEIQRNIGQAVIVDNAWVELNSGNNEVDSGIRIDIDGAGSQVSRLYRRASDDRWIAEGLFSSNGADFNGNVSITGNLTTTGIVNTTSGYNLNGVSINDLDTLSNVLYKNGNLSGLTNVVVARANLQVYSITESDNRFVNVTGDENINGRKTFFDFVEVRDGIETNIFSGGFAGQGTRLDVQTNTDTSLEVDNLIVRKTTRIFELTIKKIRNVGGSFIVTNGSEQDSVTTVADTTFIFVNGIWSTNNNAIWDFTSIWQ